MLVTASAYFVENICLVNLTKPVRTLQIFAHAVTPLWRQLSSKC